MATYREYVSRLEQLDAETTRDLIALSYEVSRGRGDLSADSRDKLTLMIHEKMMEGLRRRRERANRHPSPARLEHPASLEPFSVCREDDDG